MSFKEIDIFSLVKSYIDKSLDKDQYVILKTWLEEDKEHQKIFSDYLQVYKKYRQISFLEKIEKESAWLKITSKLNQPVSKSTKVKQLFSRVSIYKYAAIFIGIMAGGAFFYNLTQKTVVSPTEVALRLTNGTIKTLKTSEPKTILKIECNAVQLGSHLTYKKTSFDEVAVEYHKITVPYGKVFDIVLSDGTQVKLNSGSSLKYPTQFVAHKNREVLLEGEAYFEVYKDQAHPFVVNANKDINIRVLGTKFNISAYPEDKNISTVLLEGSVSLYPEKNKYNIKNSTLLSPGHMAIWDAEHRNFSVQKTDIEQHTAWLDGKLIFKDTPFKTIRKKLERKYNVQIVNDNLLLEENTFNAVFDSETIEETMEILSRSFGIHYRIKENTITLE
ncbi:DUF4974 domain-containing protein [Wenyingzhuangia sp. 1_MG-2023]|nr:DUF4974 domain-containing protein [Wenyingzhuangia sp. 1_MG-2023]